MQVLDAFGKAWGDLEKRLFGGRWPAAEIFLLAGFALVTLVDSPLIASIVFAAFVVLFVFAAVRRCAVDIALIAALYFVFRFNLIQAAPPFRYGSDLITAVSAAVFIALLAMRVARLRSYDWAFIAFGAYVLVLAVFRDVPLMPALVQIRALLGVYPLFLLVREIGFDHIGERRVAALAFYEFFAWALFVQAFIEKVSSKLLLTTAFVRYTGISVTNWPRVYGWTGNPNSLGALCVLLIALGVLLSARGFKGRWLQTALSLYFATAVLSVSRSALLSLPLLLVILLWRPTFEGCPRRVLGALVAKRFLVGAVLAGIAIVASVVFPAVVNAAVGGADRGVAIYKRLLTDEEELQGSMEGGRLFSLRTGITVAMSGVDDLLFGQGPATYGSAGSNFWKPPLYEKYEIPESFYADMFFVMMIVEVGIVGFALFAAGLLGLVRSNRDISLTWRLGILSLLIFWCFFYNVPELAMLFFPILVFIGIPPRFPSHKEAAALSGQVWKRCGCSLQS